MTTTLLNYLLYIDIGNPSFDYISDHAFGMKSGAQLPFCNRIYGTTQISQEEIENAKAFYGTTPFCWFAESKNEKLIQRLEQAQLGSIAAYPAMHISLSTIDSEQYTAQISVQEIEYTLVKKWLTIIEQSYGITKGDEFAKFIQYLIERANKGSLRLYLASYEGIPAAASMVIDHPEVAGLHWVATLPEYRGKGLGYAISHKPLIDAKARGLSSAILLASDMGKPIYEKIGFREYALYNVYGCSISFQ